MTVTSTPEVFGTPCKRTDTMVNLMRVEDKTVFQHLTGITKVNKKELG
jgi:hypothetical protein